MDLCAAFVAVRPEATPSPALEAALARAVRKGREAWPSLRLDDETFVRHLAERVQGDEPAAVDQSQAADLWLACACARADRAAIDAFAAAHLAQVATYLARSKSEALADDVRQILLTRFFVAESGRPKILEYSGRGALGAWVRVAAVRTALSLQRAPRHGSDDGLGDLVGPLDPELDAVKLRVRGAFEEALAQAFAELSARDHTLLKLHYVDGVPVESLARLYKVHRVSASRWLSDARTQVLEETRARLRARLGLTDSEFASVTRLVQSQLDVSLGRLLGSRTGRGT